VRSDVQFTLQPWPLVFRTNLSGTPIRFQRYLLGIMRFIRHSKYETRCRSAIEVPECSVGATIVDWYGFRSVRPNINTGPGLAV
jgi:hypothetical protein